jgi:hypothetical protein
VTGTRGPQHDLAFEVEVSIGDRPLARGTSRSKRLAERAAAEAGLVAFAEVGPEPFAGQSVRPRRPGPPRAGEPAKTSDPIR